MLAGAQVAGLQTDSKGAMRESAVNLRPGSTQAPGGGASTGGGVGGHSLDCIHSTGAWLGGKRMSSGHDCSASSDDQDSKDQKQQEVKGTKVC